MRERWREKERGRRGGEERRGEERKGEERKRKEGGVSVTVMLLNNLLIQVGLSS